MKVKTPDTLVPAHNNFGNSKHPAVTSKLFYNEEKFLSLTSMLKSSITRSTAYTELISVNVIVHFKWDPVSSVYFFICKNMLSIVQ